MSYTSKEVDFIADLLLSFLLCQEKRALKMEVFSGMTEEALLYLAPFSLELNFDAVSDNLLPEQSRIE